MLVHAEMHACMYESMLVCMYALVGVHPTCWALPEDRLCEEFFIMGFLREPGGCTTAWYVFIVLKTFF